MPSKLAEVTPRNFSPTLTPGLSDEARKAANAAFDAMSTWRTETVNNFEIVIDKDGCGCPSARMAGANR